MFAYGRLSRAVAGLALLAVLLPGCGKDSCISEPEVPQTAVEFGEGVEIITPSERVVRLFGDFTPTTFQGRPAILLRDLVGQDIVADPDLYGYRFMGVDGFYANQPGKAYGDNTWEQLAIGYLDLHDVGVVFQTELDPSLRKGHNVKWLVLVEVLRSVDVVWAGGRKLVAVAEVGTATVPEGYPDAGSAGVVLARLVEKAAPSGSLPDAFLYRVVSGDGSSLPRFLTWAELSATYYLPGEDRVVMAEALGSAYQLAKPKTIRMEARAR
jgi:hypothetical protein